MRKPAQDLKTERKASAYGVAKGSLLHNPLQEKQDQGNPNVILYKRQVPCVQMAHEIAVEHEYHGGKKASAPMNSQAPHEKIHEAATQQNVEQGRITVGDIWGHEIVQKP